MQNLRCITTRFMSNNKSFTLRLALKHCASSLHHVAYVSNFARNGSKHTMETSSKQHVAAVAFGSNMGDRIDHIESALKRMRLEGLTVDRLSRLYETKPMYYANQDAFLNGVCRVKTTLGPEELLDALQKVENAMGRERKVAKGPRTIDLDIVAFDELEMRSERLTIPHLLLHEREFVLRPLCDVLPSMNVFRDPETNGWKQAKHVYRDLATRDPSMSAVTSLASNLPLVRANDPTRKTLIMAVLNLTPDSFSDGGQHSVTNLNKLRDTVKQFIVQGATILDVGGQSTRPNAELLSPSEEASRVLPAIEAIRDIPEAHNIAISVDTFYSEVAAKAIDAGADIVNDVSAGVLDEAMLPTIARLGKTIILMHMRGNPSTMTNLTDYPQGVVLGVAMEVGDRVKAAIKAGIPPWRIVLDPGIGFAKDTPQNLQLLRNLAVLRDPIWRASKDLPWLVGTSRKKFIGNITGVTTASERVFGTAAAVTASVAGGADIVRVHDVSEMAQVVRIADAIYRVADDPIHPVVEHAKSLAIETSSAAGQLFRKISEKVSSAQEPTSS